MVTFLAKPSILETNHNNDNTETISLGTTAIDSSDAFEEDLDHRLVNSLQEHAL